MQMQTYFDAIICLFFWPLKQSSNPLIRGNNFGYFCYKHYVLLRNLPGKLLTKKNSPILNFSVQFLWFFELLFVFYLLFFLVKVRTNSTQTHLFVVCENKLWIRYILKFYDKALPLRPFSKLKYEKIFIFSRKARTKRKQL